MTVSATSTVTDGVVTLGTDAQARIDSLTALAKNNLAAAMWLVMNDRGTGLTEQISVLMTDIAKRNEDMKALNQEIADTIKLKNGESENDAEQESKITELKSALDTLNSNQQMSMVRLQDLMSKNGETTSLLSAVLKLIADQNQGVVQKM